MTDPSIALACAPGAIIDPRGLLADLTAEQRRAATHRGGPLLVFAGPGAGKTKTLTSRVAHLLAGGHVSARQILALTFTVRAADEMRLRLAAMLGQDALGGLTVCTFHSVCARVLRQHAKVFGRDGQFTIYDQAELARIVSHLVSDQERTHIQFELARCGEAPADLVVEQISLAKNRLWTPQHLAEHAAHPARALIAALWREVDAELRASNVFTFDDLLVCAVRLLYGYPALLMHYRERWPHVLVDEFQDSSWAQLQFLACLAGPQGGAARGSLMAVGDDDQALYSWRGAAMDGLLRFGDSFPGYEQIVLRRNFRCRPEVLGVAVRCVEHNPVRQPKALIAHKDPGGDVRLVQFGCDRDEAGWVCHEISSLIAGGLPATEILVLCRSLFWTRPLQQALTAAAISHRVIGGQSTWERAEVMDALAHISLVCNPHDRAAFRRAVAAPTERDQFARARVKAPTRGAGPATQNKVIEYARRHDIDLIEACTQAPEITQIRHGATRAALGAFGAELRAVRDGVEVGRSVGSTVLGALMIRDGPVAAYQHLLAHGEDRGVLADAKRVLEDLRSLCRAAQTYAREHGPAATLAGFLDQARVDKREVRADQDDRLTISTIHAAKGTEATAVFVIGCEERRLPSRFAIDGDGDASIDEERRLFYVAATRAKDRLVFSVAHHRFERPSDGPSRFLTEAGF